MPYLWVVDVALGFVILIRHTDLGLFPEVKLMHLRKLARVQRQEGN
ncbi:hypothetical protein [Azospirillum palustre]